MKFVIISMQDLSGFKKSESVFASNITPPSASEKALRLEVEQALAIALAMRDKADELPYIICPPRSCLHKAAEQHNIPTLPIPLHFPIHHKIRLWNWQRRFPEIFLAAIGSNAIKIASALRKMRHKKKATLVYSFFLVCHFSKNDVGGLGMGDHYVCGNALIRNQLKKLFQDKRPLKESQFSICQPGMDISENRTFESFAPVHAVPHFIFGMEQSLEAHSGALLVIRAMAALWQMDNLPPWEVRMFGGGDRYLEIYREAEKLGVISRLNILDDQKCREVVPLCNAWLAPSVNPYELPQTLWYGFIYGLPIICSNTALHQERLFPGSGLNALLIPPDNPQELAQAMIKVLLQPTLRNALVDSSSLFNHFGSLDAMTKNFFKIIQTLQN